MLVSALVATLVGFGFLVVALVTGTLWLAIACIVVCILGALLLVADTLGLGHPLARRASGLLAVRRNRHTAPGEELDGAEGDAIDGLDGESSTEITTVMPRIVSEPLPDPVLDQPLAEPVVAGTVSSRHGRHETTDDDAVDTHAHVRRDDEPSTDAPWLGSPVRTHHARPDESPDA